MHLTQRLRQEVRSFIQQRENTRTVRATRYLFDLNRYCIAQLREDRAGQMAAALTYHTLFSILPTIVLALVILKQFVGPAEQAQFRDAIKNITVQWLESSQGPDASQNGDAPPPADLKLDPESVVTPQGQLTLPAQTNGDGVDVTLGTVEARDEFTRTGEIVVKELDYWMDRLSQINFGSIGIAGVLLFIYGATGLLATIERSFNLIYDTPASRPWYVRLPLYYTTITLGPILIIAGQVIQRQFINLLAEASWTNWLVGPLVVLTPLLSTWLVLFLLYVLLPNTRVSLRSAGIGSFMAAVGWVLSVELFGVYVGKAAVATLYGALALMPLTLLFLWITWVIVLFGLEVTYTLQTLPGRRLQEAQKQKQEKSDEQKQLYDARWIIPIMTLIGQSFEKGKPVKAETLAQELRLPRSAVAALADRLVRESVLHHVEGGDTGSGPSYALARPPHAITISDLLEIGEQMSMSEQVLASLPGRNLIEQLTCAEREAMSKATLAAAVEARS
jgi:membrane protein